MTQQANTVTLAGSMKSLLKAKQDADHVVSEAEIQLVLIGSSCGGASHRRHLQPYRELIAIARRNTPVPAHSQPHPRGA